MTRKSSSFMASVSSQRFLQPIKHWRI